MWHQTFTNIQMIKNHAIGRTIWIPGRPIYSCPPAAVLQQNLPHNLLSIYYTIFGNNVWKGFSQIFKKKATKHKIWLIGCKYLQILVPFWDSSTRQIRNHGISCWIQMKQNFGPKMANFVYKQAKKTNLPKICLNYLLVWVLNGSKEVGLKMGF